MDTVERWLSLEEISNHLGVSKDTVRSWIKKILFHFTKLEDNINSECLKKMIGLKVVKVLMQTNNGNWRK